MKATQTYILSEDATKSTRANAIEYAWQAYKGTLGPALRVRAGRPDDNVSINLCKPVVNKSVSFLFGKDIDISLDLGDDDEDTREEKYLDAVLRRNKHKKLFQNVAKNGSIAGHAFIKIELHEPFPRLINLNPANVLVTTKGDDHTQILRYRIQWIGPYRDPVTNERKTAAYRQVIERSDQTTIAPSEMLETLLNDVEGRELYTDSNDDEATYWRIIDQVKPGSKDWSDDDLKGAEEDRVKWETLNAEVWPYPFSPILDCQNLPNPNEFWGVSDLEPDIIQVQKNINRAASNINKVLRLHAHPKTWAQGLTEDQLRMLSVNPEGIIALPAESSLHNLEMTSDLESSITYYRELYHAFHELTNTPEVTTGRLENIGNLAALAIKLLYGPMIEKTENKQLLYGEMLTDLCSRLLYIKFGTPTSSGSIDEETGLNEDRVNAADEWDMDEWVVTITWPEIVPQDPVQEAQGLLIDMQLGASKTTLLKKRGYDPEAEKLLRDAEAEEARENLQAAQDAFTRGQTNATRPSDINGPLRDNLEDDDANAE
jgi:hypothetical protein